AGHRQLPRSLVYTIMAHQKELLSVFSRSYERILLLFCSFGNPFSDFVGVNDPRVAPTMDVRGSGTMDVRGSGLLTFLMRHNTMGKREWYQNRYMAYTPNKSKGLRKID